MSLLGKQSFDTLFSNNRLNQQGTLIQVSAEGFPVRKASNKGGIRTVIYCAEMGESGLWKHVLPGGFRRRDSSKR